MNIVISNNSYENNTTSDYNIVSGLKILKALNKTVYFDFYLEKDFNYDYNFLKNKYKMEINSIITIQTNHKKFKNFPDSVKQIKFIVDVHGWYGDNGINSFTDLTLLLPYAYSYGIFNYKINNNIIFFPHSVKHAININKNPINKILVSGRGRKNPNRYPMRHFMYKKSLKDNRIDYFKPDHGYRENNNNHKFITCGKKYIEKLNNYLCCFCDDMSSISPYLVAKFFEITSSGALLLASLSNTKAYFEKLGFIENINYILLTKDNYDEKISFILDPKNRKKIDEIRTNGYNLCNSYHTSYYRAKQLHNFLVKGKETLTHHFDGMYCGEKRLSYYTMNLLEE